MNNGVGLVLAGGGGKGSYFIGVWKALIEYGVDKNISSISGTSVGALNAVLFAQDNYDIAEEIWKNISTDKILKVDLKKTLINILGMGYLKGDLSILNMIFREFYGSGIFSREGLIDIMDKYIDLNYISNSRRNIYATAFNVNTLKTEYLKINRHDKEKIKKILIASSALPLIYDKVEIDGQNYIDGGIKDNVPISPLYNEGIRNFIIVHLGRDSIINKKCFKNSNIIEIVPNKGQGDLVSGTLDFSQEGILRRINQGYEETIKVLKPMYEMGILQSNIAKKMNLIKVNEIEFIEQKKIALSDRKTLKNELNKIINKK